MTTRRKAANGAGSIFQRGDGRWCGAMYVTEADGRRVRRRVYGRTRKEAESKLVDLRSKAESGLPVTPSRLTVEAYLQEWLSTIVAQRVRPNTLSAYRLNVEKYLVPGLGRRPLGQLTAREVRLFLDRLTAQVLRGSNRKGCELRHPCWPDCSFPFHLPFGSEAFWVLLALSEETR